MNTSIRLHNRLFPGLPGGELLHIVVLLPFVQQAAAVLHDLLVTELREGVSSSGPVARSAWAKGINAHSRRIMATISQTALGRASLRRGSKRHGGGRAGSCGAMAGTAQPA